MKTIKTAELDGRVLFNVGDAVRIVRVNAPEVNGRHKFIGKIGRATRVLKTCVRIEFDDGDVWVADVANIEPA